MDTHKNARLTPKGREEMVRSVVDDGLTYGERPARNPRCRSRRGANRAELQIRGYVFGLAVILDRASRFLRSRAAGRSSMRMTAHGPSESV
jgi:leucine-zipper of insertion element IS481